MMRLESSPTLPRAALLGATWLGLAAAGLACTIPVFRYALDRWETDQFTLLLPPAVSKQEAIRDLLRPLRAGGGANLQVRDAAEGDVTEPTLFFPDNKGGKVWSGPLAAESLNAMIASPAREEIIRRIATGESVIWVMADLGTPEDNERAAHITRRLAFLEQAAALPPQDPDDPDSQLGPGPPLKLQFSLMRLRLDDPAEAMLLEMLKGPANATIEAGKPFVAAMFGRGRVLGAWPAEDVTDLVLEDAGMFLIGQCSCRVKNQNPGWDVLLNVDWDAELPRVAQGMSKYVKKGEAAPPAPLVAAAKVEAKPVVEEVKIAPTEAKPAEEATLALNWAVVAPALLVLLGSIWWLAARGRA